MTPKCTATVDRSHSSRWVNMQPCGRDAVTDGLCSLHLRVRAKRQEKAAAYQAERDRAEQLKDEASALSLELDIDVKPEYDGIRKRGYTGAFVVPGDWLRQIAEGSR